MTPAARRKRRLEFERHGVSVAQWARENRFNTNLVYQVLNGESKALRGQSHDIAVKLGIKEGICEETRNE
jgi:gp16 family phage-associated protein